jgi:ribosomal protein S27AE
MSRRSRGRMHKKPAPSDRPVPAASFTCPVCGAVSHHPDDVAEGYCGKCHAWTGQGG